MKKIKSEFGKGFIYNFILFVHHIDNLMHRRLYNISFILKKSQEERSKILCDNPKPRYDYGKDINEEVKWWIGTIVPIWGTEEKALSKEITLWMNGAKDHLYELEIPEKYKNHKIGKLCVWLKDFCLEMGK